MRTAPLGDVAKFINGVAFKPEDWHDSGLPIIRIQNLTDATKPINLTNRQVDDKYKVKRGDILVSWSATLGVFTWDRTDEALVNQHIFRVIPDTAVVDPGYLKHILQGALVSMEKHLHGATMKHVNRGEFLATEIPLPPIDQQRRIAATLDQAEAVRVLRLESVAALDELVGSLFDEVSRTRPSTSMPLSDAYWFQEGPGIRKWQFTDSGVKLLNVGNITADGRLDLSKTERHVSADEANGRYKHFLVDPGDLVIASSGISFDADGLLRTRGAFVDEMDLPLCMNTSTIRFKAQTGLSDLTYLRSWLNSAEFRSQISRLVTGTAQQNFGPSHLRQLQITLPPVSVQEEFAHQVRAIERHRSKCLEALAQSDQMTASIQFDAVTGRI